MSIKYLVRIIPRMGSVRLQIPFTSSMGTIGHGNPTVYDPNTINGVTGTTHGARYLKTRARENELLAMGYNLVVMWEKNYMNGDDPITYSAGSETVNMLPDYVPTGTAIGEIVVVDGNRYLKTQNSLQLLCREDRCDIRMRGDWVTCKNHSPTKKCTAADMKS